MARKGLLLTFDEVRRLGNNGNLMKLLLGLCILVRSLVSSVMPQEHVRMGLEMRMGGRGEWFLEQESPIVYRP